MPLWVKVFIVVGVVLVVGFIISAMAGVQHGPDLHQRPPGGHTTPGP